MQNIHKLSIIFSFFGLWLVSILSPIWQTYVGFFFIFTFGIIHGTNDLMLISKINSKNAVNHYKILATYLFAILIVVVLFNFLPFLTLALFICFSSYHFGEQHFEYLEQCLNKTASYGFMFLYGLLILTLLFYSNSVEVVKIIQDMTGVLLHAKLFFYGIIIILSSVVIFGIYIGRKSLLFKNRILTELFYLLVFLIIFKSTTLIWGFALYFILWHSIPSIKSQIEFIYGKTDKHSVLNYIKTGSIFWLISMVGMILIFIIFQKEQLFYTLFFSFIIAITFPHVIVIQKMFSKKYTQIDN